MRTIEQRIERLARCPYFNIEKTGINIWKVKYAVVNGGTPVESTGLSMAHALTKAEESLDDLVKRLSP